MKRKTKITLAIASPFILMVLLFELFILSMSITGVPSRITGDKIKQIERGMSKEEVISILGEPFKIYDDETNNHLSYTRDFLLIGGISQFYVSLDDDNRVYSVYIKERWTDNTIYDTGYINEESFNFEFEQSTLDRLLLSHRNLYRLFL